MPTPAEQKALVFVALVVLLGGTVRVVRGGALASRGASPAEQQALVHQASSANSAAVLDRAKKGQKGRKSERPTARTRVRGAKFDSTGLLVEGTGVVSTTGFPPPGPRIDVDLRQPSPSASGQQVGRRGLPSAVPVVLDIDVATIVELERLPGIGPALARRIVASRDSLGAFGVLSALSRVKGVGPATIQRLAPLVTFSGQARR